MAHMKLWEKVKLSMLFKQQASRWDKQYAQVYKYKYKTSNLRIVFTGLHQFVVPVSRPESWSQSVINLTPRWRDYTFTF